MFLIFSIFCDGVTEGILNSGRKQVSSHWNTLGEKKKKRKEERRKPKPYIDIGEPKQILTRMSGKDCCLCLASMSILLKIYQLLWLPNPSRECKTLSRIGAPVQAGHYRLYYNFIMVCKQARNGNWSLPSLLAKILLPQVSTSLIGKVWVTWVCSEGDKRRLRGDLIYVYK